MVVSEAAFRTRKPFGSFRETSPRVELLEAEFVLHFSKSVPKLTIFSLSIPGNEVEQITCTIFRKLEQDDAGQRQQEYHLTLEPRGTGLTIISRSIQVNCSRNNLCNNCQEIELAWIAWKFKINGKFILVSLSTPYNLPLGYFTP